MKYLKIVLLAIAFFVIFLIPVEFELESDGFLKLGRPFVYYWKTHGPIKTGLSNHFSLLNIILNIIIYCILLFFIVKLPQIKKTR